MTLFSIRNLAVRAGDAVLQRGISLDMDPGDLVAVSGPSGCGKTTLLRTVVGLIDAAEGEILLGGKEPAAYGWPAYRRKVVLVAQQPALIDGTVNDNLRRPFSYRTSYGCAFPEIRARTLMERLGLGADRLMQEAGSLSLGQRQRVSLIRALLLDPLVVCLDEPTSALDPDSVAAVQDAISEEGRAHGLAALIVTHQQEQAETWCSRRIVLAAALNAEGDAA